MQIAEADLEFTDTQTLYDSTMKEWEELARQFAKDPKTNKPEQFFAIIDDFSQMWTRSIETRKAKLERELKERKKAEAQEEIRKKKIELAQRQAQLKAKKAAESKPQVKSEEDTQAEAELGQMLRTLSSTSLARRQERGAIRQQRRNSNVKRGTSLNVTLPSSPPLLVLILGLC